MKNILTYLFLLFCLSSSCQSKSYDSLDLNNDLIIKNIEINDGYISKIDVIIDIKNQLSKVSELDDINIIYFTLGSYAKNDEYISIGQQVLIPSENITITRNEIKLLDMKYTSKYLILTLDLSKIKIQNIDSFTVYFHLRNMNKKPILRYNTDVLYFKSERVIKS